MFAASVIGPYSSAHSVAVQSDASKTIVETCFWVRGASIGAGRGAVNHCIANPDTA